VTQSRAVLVATVVVSAFVGGLLAMLGAFFVPSRSGWFSLGDALALVTIGPYAFLVGRALRSPLAGVPPALAWLFTTMYFASLRPEGDLIVTGEATGLAFLLLGTLSAAVGVGTIRNGIARADRRAAARALADEAAAAAAAVAAGGDAAR
jgi:hypothetical protein